MESLRDLIAVTRRIFQIFPAHDPYVTAAIFDQAAILQGTCNHGNGRTLCPQHLGQELLCESERVGFPSGRAP